MTTQRSKLDSFLLLAVLMMSPVASACTPNWPSAQEAQALSQIKKLSKKVKCPSDKASSRKLECVQYNAPPRKTATLLAQSLGVKPRKKGEVWLVKDAKQGRLTRVMAQGNGSLAQTTDRESAYEILTKRLNNHEQRYEFDQWKDCGDAHLDKAGPIRIQYCKVLLAANAQPFLQFEVTRSFDQSMPKGLYSWFVNTGANCGGHITLKENKEKRRRK